MNKWESIIDRSHYFKPTSAQLEHINAAMDKAAAEVGLIIVDASETLGTGYRYCYGLGPANE